MSTKYQHGDAVPSELLCKRLHELSDAVTKGRDAIDQEFTMRIPAELDRDADLVLSESARRLEQLQKRNAELEENYKRLIEHAAIIEISLRDELDSDFATESWRSLPDKVQAELNAKAEQTDKKLRPKTVSELKPCPFCGANNCLVDAYYDESAVRCQKCKATGPEGNYQECQDKWDTRAQPKQPSDEEIAEFIAKNADPKHLDFVDLLLLIRAALDKWGR